MEDKKKKHTQEDLDNRIRQVEALLPYRHVRLNTGEEFIAQIVMNIVLPDTLMTRYPFRVLTAEEPEDGSALFALVPMYPFTKQEVIPIMKSAVISITSIRPEVQALYLETVAEYLEDESELGALSFSSVEEEDDESDDDGEPKPTKKKTWVN